MIVDRCDVNMSLPSPMESYATAVVSFLLALITIPGNLLVCLAVLKTSNKNIRNPFNFFVLSLAIADLVVGCVTEPLSVYVHVKEALRTRVYFVEVECLHMSYFISCTTSMLSICLLGIERYIAITSPLKFRLFFSVRRFVVLATVVWLLSIALSCIYLFTTYATYALVFSTNAVAWTLGVSVFTYTKIVRRFNERLYNCTVSSVLHRSDKKDSKTLRNKQNGEKKSSVFYGHDRSPSSRPLSLAVDIKHESRKNDSSPNFSENSSRINNKLSAKRIPNGKSHSPPNPWNVKLIKTYLVIISIFLACYFPACAVIYTMKWCTTCSCVTLQYLQDLQFIIIAVQSALNPFVYAFRFKRFRHVVLKMLRCSPRSRPNLQSAATFKSNTTLTRSITSLQCSLRKNVSEEL